MSLQVGQLYALLKLDRAPFERDLGAAEQQGQRFLSGFGRIAAGAGVAMAGAFAVAGVAGSKMAGDLQQSVANISTIKPEINTSAVFAALDEMSTRVPQTATQLGDSLYNIFSSFDVGQEQALQLVETFARGATGAGTSAQTFGTAVLGVMNAYGLAAEDASRVSDVFFNTVNAGVVTGEELATSLGTATQAAKMAGVGLEELGGFIAGVTKEGGPAAQNINNLTNFLQKFTTADAQKALNDLGVATVDATGTFRPTTDVLAELKARLGGMTEAARANALQAIFPDLQARTGAQTLLSQLDFVNRAIETNKTQAGSASRAYETMSATFNSQMTLLQNTFSSILTRIGAEILPAVTPLVTAFAQWLPGAFEAARSALGPVVAAFLAFLPTLQSVGGQILAIGQQLVSGDVSAAFAGLGSLLAPAIASVQAAMEGFAPTGERIGALFGTIASAVASLIPEPVAGLIRGFFDSGTAASSAQGAFDLLVGAVNTVSGAIQSVTQFVSDNQAAQAALVGILAAATTAWGLMKAAALAQTAVTSGVAAATRAYTAVQAALNVVMAANPIGLVVIALAGLAAAFVYAYNNIQPFRDAVDGAVAAVLAAGQAFVQWASALPGTIGGLFDQLGADVRAALDGIGQAIQNAWSGFLATITGFLDGIRSAVTAVWTAIPEDIRADLALIAGHLLSKGAEFVATVTGWLGEIWTAVTTKWAEITTAVGTALGEIGSSVATKWAEISSAIGTSLGEIWTAVSGKWTEITTATSTAWGTVQSTIGAKVGEALAAVTTFAGNVLSSLAGLAGSAASQAASIGSGIIDGIRGALLARANELANAAADAVRRALNAAKAALGIQSPSRVFAAEVGAPAVEGIMLGLRRMEPALRAQLAGLVQPPRLAMQLAPAPAASAGSGTGAMAGTGASSRPQINQTIYGAEASEVQRQTERALRRLATDWALG